MYALLVCLVTCFAAGEFATPAPADAAAESVELRYCRAQLQLAEANLARLEQMNQKVARTVPVSLLAERKQQVAVARLRLQQAEAGEAGNPFAVWLRRAKANQSEAAMRWQQAVAVNQRAANTIDPRDVGRYRLRAEVCRLQFERGQELAGASRAAQLEWRVELLTNELDWVRDEATRIMPSARYYYYSFPGWWW
ncbi:MAG: hypothetical protein WD845_11025 [Pirellulales bacterium]